MLAPFLPFTCEQLHIFLGYTDPLFGSQYVETMKDNLGEHEVLRFKTLPLADSWKPSRLEAGRKLVQPGPLFKKLDVSIVEEERSKLGKK